MTPFEFAPAQPKACDTMAAYRVPVVLMILLSVQSAAAQSLDVDVTLIKKLVMQWNDAHASGGHDAFNSLYADSVFYYGSTLPRTRCLANKRLTLEESGKFTQSIKNELFLTGYSNGLIRCDFVTIISRGNSESQQWNYLLINDLNDEYVIVAESNQASDIVDYPYYDRKASVRDVPRMQKVSNHSGYSTLKIIVDVTLLIASIALAVIILLIVFRKWAAYRERDPSRRKIKRKRLTHFSSAARGEFEFKQERHFDNKGEIGLAFEKYIVKRFTPRYFTLLDWRSDKFHDGIYAKSIRYPDLVYEYKLERFVRNFSVECKFRGSPKNDVVSLMNEEKYRVYEEYHKTQTPVYIALGLGGRPFDPRRLFLIPFMNVKPEMTVSELKRYEKLRHDFYYDIESDRLR